MRELDDALKALSDFESLVEYGLYPDKSLEKVEYENEWDSFSFARIEFRVGQLTVEANAHSSCSNGRLNVWVWNLNNPPRDVCRFDMGGDAEHAARVVVDYINEYEVSA